VIVNVVVTERLPVGIPTFDTTELAISELPVPVVPTIAVPPLLEKIAVNVVPKFSETSGTLATNDVITGGLTTFTVVEFDLVGSATDVAVIVYIPAVIGAVHVAPDHEPAPPELQLTAILTAFSTTAA
jgi:hypothetical protein